MEDYILNRTKSRWAVLEDRTCQITKMLDELEEIEHEFESISLKTTTVYIVLQSELELIAKEQKFIERLWK